ncbi:uncharacterized protein LOC117221735 isoform X2 [Megalopta genalis]|uniref:uncharacterized protein LOC117221735 isoform X2 n=1 Tax=Megalopta genalis TaxID=115081 RepID=UPI003FD51A35
MCIASAKLIDEIEMDEGGQGDKDNSFIEPNTEHDSILDFKSPDSKIAKSKSCEFVKPSNIKQKRKATTKLKSITKNQKDTESKQKLKKGSFEHSIKSSYFEIRNSNDHNNLITDMKVACVCPLCFKTFKDINTRAVHMKICACKNNISTKKLLDAIELQKRQEDERKSLGLPAAPRVQEKKKSVSHKVSLGDDSDLNLALALSKSLQEAKEIDKVNDIGQLSKVETTTFRTAEPMYKSQLGEHGFTNVEPVIFVQNRKRIHNAPTTLQTRTQEERNSILIENIAKILMNDEPFTQISKKEAVCNKKFAIKTDLKSYLLQDLFYEECREDDRIPSENETEKSMNEKAFYKMSQKNLHLINGKCENCNDKQYIDALSNNWGNVLNDSSASDIIIFVDNNKHIWAHKLVFYVQCSNILLDVMPNDNLQFTTIKEKICWPNVTYNIALAFLEFIYCGTIKKNFNICKNILNFPTLRNLARKYKVKHLFTYLQRKEAEIKQDSKIQIENTKGNDYRRTLIAKEDNLKEYSIMSRSLLCEREEENKESLHEDKRSSKEYLENILNNSESYRIEIESSVLPTTSTLSVKNKYENLISPIRQYNVSPDMFDDVNDSITSYTENSLNQIIDVNKSQRFNDIDIVDTVDLVEIDTDFAKIQDLVLSKSIEENMNSLKTTPQSSRLKRNSINKSDIKKTKSNLSLFIEQFQAENAKSDVDTDSDITIMKVSPKLKRNPFNVEDSNFNQSFIFTKTNTVVKEKLGIKTDVLSKFDYDITSFPLQLDMTSEESGTNVNLDLNLKNNLTQSLEDNKERCTQKSMECNSLNNSITSTEDVVQNIISPVTENSLKNSVNDQDINSSIEKCIESDGSIVTDFHSDDGELSMYTRYKKEHQNNSIAKYRSFTKKNLPNNCEKISVKNSSEDDYCEVRNNVNTEDISILLDEDTSDFTIISKKKEERVFNLEKSSLSFSECPTNFNKMLDNELDGTINSSELRYTKSESNIDIETNENNFSVLLSERKSKQQNSSEFSVLVLSSPEIDSVTLNVDTYKKIVDDNVLNLNEFDNNDIFEKDIYLANVHIHDDNDDDNKIKKTSIIETNNKNNESITTNNANVMQLKKSLATAQDIKTFKRRSKSETNLGNNKNNIKNYTFSFNTVEQSPCRCCHKQILREVKSPIITRDSCTPPPDYDGMKTSELHAELHKYGLKMQKRSRAVKLLTYIYNELHPIIPLRSKIIESELVAISSDDEQSAKRRKNNNINESNNYSNEYGYDSSPLQSSGEKLPVNIINEERQLDENRTCALNIKDAFFALITDQKELYNNILTYEPLCIESIYFMLKEKGFKYKMNTLMDFLDEQCITFYSQDAKLSRKKKVDCNRKGTNKRGSMLDD